MTDPAIDPAIASPRIARVGGWFGIAGPVLLTVYFAAPVVAGWPYAGGTDAQLTAYARSHESLFYAGAWLQVTGALLSVVFFLVLATRTGKGACFVGRLVTVGAALLIGVVVMEATFLIAVPMAAAAGSGAGVSTAFTLSNGVFARVFPLAPAPLLFAATGLALRHTAVLPRAFAPLALVVAGLFELAGIAAIFSTAGLIAAIAMSILQEVWIVAAAIALLLRARTTTAAAPVNP
ncbi:hypothetical protein [Leifsonia sp. EB34]|uniref:hypothetical protein n=1 Tax=Leifsonia sp. EB34 TaxID=3156303 RepID=UPI00351498B8